MQNKIRLKTRYFKEKSCEIAAELRAEPVGLRRLGDLFPNPHYFTSKCIVQVLGYNFLSGRFYKH